MYPDGDGVKGLPNESYWQSLIVAWMTENASLGPSNGEARIISETQAANLGVVPVDIKYFEFLDFGGIILKPYPDAALSPVKSAAARAGRAGR